MEAVLIAVWLAHAAGQIEDHVEDSLPPEKGGLGSEEAALAGIGADRLTHRRLRASAVVSPRRVAAADAALHRIHNPLGGSFINGDVPPVLFPVEGAGYRGPSTLPAVPGRRGKGAGALDFPG